MAVVELESCGGPSPDDGAAGVVVDGIFVVLAPKEACVVCFLAVPGGGAPSPEDGMPACEPDPRSEVGHDDFDIVLASCGVDSWPAGQFPLG